MYDTGFMAMIRGKGLMAKLTTRQRKTLSRNIRLHKDRIYPGHGSGNQLALALDVSPQLVSFWINNRRIPSDFELAKLAALFNVSMFDLCGMHKPKQRNGKNPAMNTIELLSIMHNTALNRAKSCTVPKSLMIKINQLIYNEFQDIS